MWTAFLEIDTDEDNFPYRHLYLEAPKSEAINIFKSWYGFLPIGISCPQCGLDYTIDEYNSLSEALEDNYFLLDESLEEYKKRSDIRIFTKEDIGNTPRKEHIYPDHFHECDTSGCRIETLQNRISSLEYLLYDVCDKIASNTLNLEEAQQKFKKILNRGS